MADVDPTRLPVIAEELHVGRRTVETGRVRITRALRSDAREVVLPDAVRTAVAVERVAIGRPVERLDPPRVEGDVTIIPIYEEVAVVTRQWILKEELRVRTERRSKPQPAQRITLRRQHVDIQRDAQPREALLHGAPASAGAPAFSHKHNKNRSPDPSLTGASMNSTTIVGVFDGLEQAQDAARRLESAGIDTEAIRIESTSDTTRAEPRGEGGTLRSFFAELFGIGAGSSNEDDGYPGHYAEAVRRGSTVLAVQAHTDEQTTMVVDLLESCGAIDIDERLEQWRGSGYERHDETQQPDSAGQIAGERDRAQARDDETGATLPVVEESLKVGKREVARGRVRVHRRIVETPVEEEVALREQRAVVERRAVDRPASPADIEALQDETIEFTESAEEPVVEKTARVVEEVRLDKRVEERKATVRDTVRRAEVEVENATASSGSARRSGSGSTGVVVGGAAGAGSSKPGSARRAYDGPERRRSTASAYTGTERRVAME